MKNLLKNFGTLVALAAVVFLSSCEQERSGATGWSYNDEKNGGFERNTYTEQETGPGLVLIEGGTFTMGRVEDDVAFGWDNYPRRVTVSSFYITKRHSHNRPVFTQ